MLLNQPTPNKPTGVDFVQIAKGARNPFRSTVDPKSGDIYFGDVGSSVWEVRRLAVLACSVVLWLTIVNGALGQAM